MSANMKRKVVHSETKELYYIFEAKNGIKYVSKDVDALEESLDALNINLEEYVEEDEIIQGRYRHFKGNEYAVLGIAYDLDGEKYVFYEALYQRKDIKHFIRPYEMFFSFTDKKKYPGATQDLRFERV